MRFAAWLRPLLRLSEPRPRQRGNLLRKGRRCEHGSETPFRLSLHVAEPADDWTQRTQGLLNGPPPLPAARPPHPHRPRPSRSLPPVLNTPKPRQPMSRGTVSAVTQSIGAIFSHNPHAICGPAALMSYGWDMFSPEYITVLCPQDAMDTIRCWAIAKGIYDSASLDELAWEVE